MDEIDKNKIEDREQEPQQERTEAARVVRWPRLRRFVKRTVQGVLLSIGSVAAIVLIYLLFFLHYSSSTPTSWQRKPGPAAELAIPDECTVEQAVTNPYTRPDYDGYSIRRYRFVPDSSEITEFSIDWFDPKGAKPGAGYPLVMNAPITGGGMHLENVFSRYFADHGMAVCLVHRPEAYDREKTRLGRSGYWWRMMARQSRLAYRWALQRRDVDPGRTASFGISNGGFRNVFFAAAEPDVKAHVICLAGGDLADILTESDFVAESRAYEMRERGLDEEGLRQWLRETIELEPLDYAPFADPASILMICARFDTTVPYKNGVWLWEAFGKPEFIALPFGHYTSAFAIPYLKREALQFMVKRFEENAGG